MAHTLVRMPTRCASAIVMCALSASVAMFVFTLYVGAHSLETRPTDPISEQLTLREARKISQGEHSYGIVEYTHYPNGPQYVIALMIKAGMYDGRHLRIAPVVFFAACVGILGFYICISSAHLAIALLGVVGVGAIVLQPGVAQWMGALYGNSYLLALCMLALGISLSARSHNWTLALVGFISGWMGYDFTFCLIGSIFVGRFISSSHNQKSWLKCAWAVFTSIVAGASGVIAATVGHFIQNALFFGSSRLAFNDLVGSAAARAGLHIASELNPSYAHMIDAASRSQQNGENGNYSRWELTYDLFQSFTTPEWTNWNITLPIFGAACMANIALLVYLRFMRGSWTQILTPMLVSGISIAVGLVLGILWFILMPQHARFHFHFIQRHFFVSLTIVWIALWHIANSLWSSLQKFQKSPYFW